jgi:hypothetical protein
MNFKSHIKETLEADDLVFLESIGRFCFNMNKKLFFEQIKKSKRTNLYSILKKQSQTYPTSNFGFLYYDTSDMNEIEGGDGGGEAITEEFIGKTFKPHHDYLLATEKKIKNKGMLVEYQIAPEHVVLNFEAVDKWVRGKIKVESSFLIRNKLKAISEAIKRVKENDFIILEKNNNMVGIIKHINKK